MPNVSNFSRMFVNRDMNRDAIGQGSPIGVTQRYCGDRDRDRDSMLGTSFFTLTTEPLHPYAGGSISQKRQFYKLAKPVLQARKASEKCCECVDRLLSAKRLVWCGGRNN